MKVAAVASEVVPFSKTGGLADVAGALPGALARLGVEVVTVTPLHRSARRHALEKTGLVVRVPVGDATVEAAVYRSGSVYFLEHDPYFDRDGLYGTPAGDYPDNASRFVFLARAALELLRQLGRPDVIQAHDWQAGLVPIYVKTLYAEAFAGTRSVFTIHNLAYQGVFWHLDMPLTGLDWSHFTWRGLEFFGKLSFLKAGLVHADALTTVSPTYAREIQTPEFGCGLDGVLRERAASLHGILNGVDYAEWDPERDPHLAARYSASDLEGKERCKAALQKRCGLPARPDVPLVGMIGRLSEQKGLDIFLEAADALAQQDLQFVILGSGDRRYREAVERVGDRYRNKVSVHVAFDNALAHQIEAGSDLFLMPSRYEPCGLNQIYSLRYGAVPVVRATGGLADTVVDGVTGFTFGPYAAGALLEAVGRARAAYADRALWGRIQREGMKQDFSWDASARRYAELFRSLAAPARKPGAPGAGPRRRGRPGPGDMLE
jgi:starch synthase